MEYPCSDTHCDSCENGCDHETEPPQSEILQSDMVNAMYVLNEQLCQQRILREDQIPALIDALEERNIPIITRIIRSITMKHFDPLVVNDFILDVMGAAIPRFHRTFPDATEEDIQNEYSGVIERFLSVIDDHFDTYMIAPISTQLLCSSGRMNIIKGVLAFINRDFTLYLHDILNLRDAKAVTMMEMAHEVWEFNNELWENIYEIVKHAKRIGNFDNEPLFQYLKDKATIARIIVPAWIKDFPVCDGEITDPYIGLPEILVSPKMAVSLIMNLSVVDTDRQKNLDIVEKGLLFQYSVAPLAQRCTLLSMPPIDDLTVFREFGPLNTRHDHTVPTSDEDPCDICSRYGGCRMLTCCCYGTDLSDMYSTDIMDANDECEDWYTGVCDKCQTTIYDRYCSLRLPVLNGGWIGCYCSEECALKLVDNDEEKSMLTTVRTQLDAIGIRRRD